MFRCLAKRAHNVLSSAVRISAITPTVSSVRYSHGEEEPAEEFDKRYEKFFNRSDIDHWEIRKAMNDLSGYDLVPEPKIVIAALKACRRLNDYALAVRYLESIKSKCGGQVNTIWPYMLQEIRPTLKELGVLTPEEMGYDKPELAMQDVYDM